MTAAAVFASFLQLSWLLPVTAAEIAHAEMTRAGFGTAAAGAATAPKAPPVPAS